MKHIIGFVVLPLLIIGGIVYWLYYTSKNKLSILGKAVTTGTASAPLSWFPGWTGFTAASLQNTTATVVAAQSALSQLSTSFGLGSLFNGVSVGGSVAGGVQSSGSGAGQPSSGLASPGINFDLTDTALYDTSGSLNNYSGSGNTDSLSWLNP